MMLHRPVEITSARLCCRAKARPTAEQCRDHRQVGFEQADAFEIAYGAPVQRRSVERLRLAAIASDYPQVEQHAPMRILVLVGNQRRRFVDFDAELLAQLANERVARLLAGLALAAGKFPTARHVLAGRTLRNEHAARGVEQGAGDDVNQAFLSFFRQRAMTMLVLLP